MNWLHHDLAWWGFVIALVALILMLPANLLANFLTPMLKNWWAERSKSAIQKRIERLRTELVHLQGHRQISDFEYYSLLGIELLSALAMFGTEIASFGTLFALSLLQPTVNPYLYRSTEILLAVLLLVAFVAFAAIRTIIGKFARVHSPFQRKSIERSIAFLQTKL